MELSPELAPKGAWPLKPINMFFYGLIEVISEVIGTRYGRRVLAGEVQQEVATGLQNATTKSRAKVFTFFLKKLHLHALVDWWWYSIQQIQI
eukprot:gene295-168_t